MVRNWVFLGDSLTEGVGSKRISHVAELVKQLRSSGTNVHEFRLRHVDNGFNRQIDFNVAGLMNVDADQQPSDLWLWNLACEGQTIDSDFGWLPLIAALNPEVVVIFRGSLESIIRPAMAIDGSWPWWVPQSWRGYAAMDPRCYFSTTWWRKAKQTSVDALKQKARLKLLKSRPGKPLLDVERFATYQSDLLKRLRAMGTRVLGPRGGAGIRYQAYRYRQLDAAPDLDIGDPTDLGRRYHALRREFGHFCVLGGCCGTDHRHVEQISLACVPVEA